MSGLMGSRTNAVIPNLLNGVQINQAIYGIPYPLVYGKVRISPFCLWYGDFNAVAQTQSGGGKGGHGQTTGYAYSAALLMGLCEGPITSAPTSYVDRSSIANHTTLGWSLALGAAGQSVWSYLTTNHPTQAIGYDHTAYVFGGPFPLGSSAALPNSSFEIVALLSNATYGGDAAPAAIISDYCTDPNHGAGFNSLATLTGTNSYDAYCQAMGFFLSPAEKTQRTAAAFLKEIVQITNSNAVWSGSQLKIIPYGDTAVTGNGVTWSPTNGNGASITTPIYSFGDDEFLDDDRPVIETRKPVLLTYNYYTVEYRNRSNAYNSDIATASDAKDIALNGERAAAVLSFHSITVPAVARTVAQLILQRDLYYRNTMKFKVRVDYCLLEAMDVIAVTDTGAGIINQLARIIEIQDDADDVLTITAEELPLGPGHVPQYSWDGAAGYMDNALASPGSVDTPFIFSIPPLMVSGTGGFELGIAVAGTGAEWGGCNVHMSLDGGTTYTQIGTIVGPARYGTLTAAFPLNTADPDTTSTLSVSLVDTMLSLSPASQADVDAYRTMMIVDSELLSYRDSTLITAGNFNLAYFHRGLYGSTIASHAIGALWARIDQYLFRIPFDPGFSGQTATFKFTSFNIFGRSEELLSAVTAYSHTIQSSTQPDLATLICSSGVTAQNGSAFKSGTTNAWDASCYSTKSYTNGCTAECYFSQTNLELAIGLTTNPTASNSYTNLAHGWLVNTSGILNIWDGGALMSYGSYTTGTHLQITYDGRFVTYWLNGVIELTVPVIGATFYEQICFYSAGAAAYDIRFGSQNSLTPTQFIGRGNCIVADSSVTKVGGAAAWDSDFYSVNGYATCNVVFKANQTTGALMVGLISAPNPNHGASGYTALVAAFYLQSGGTWELYELGSPVAGVSGTYDSTTRFAITYDGASLTYYVDGVRERGISYSPRTFYLDSSFYTPGAGINSLDWGPGATIPLIDTSGIGANAASVVASNAYSGTLNYPVYPSAQSVAALAVTYVATGVPVGIDISVDVQFVMEHVGLVSPMAIYIARDGVQVGTANFDAYGWIENTTGVGSPVILYQTHVTLTAMDTPSAGSHTYSLYLHSAAATAAGSPLQAYFQLINPTIKVREYKK